MPRAGAIVTLIEVVHVHGRRRGCAAVFDRPHTFVVIDIGIASNLRQPVILVVNHRLAVSVRHVAIEVIAVSV
ncbi:MAG: hypothetical protein WAN11_27340 [Syntrophobacteraceae bacterium]